MHVARNSKHKKTPATVFCGEGFACPACNRTRGNFVPTELGGSGYEDVAIDQAGNRVEARIQHEYFNANVLALEDV